MKKVLSLATILLSMSIAAFAQKNYNTAIGVQLGSPTGFHLKHYLSTKNSIEAVIGGSSTTHSYNNNGWGDRFYSRAIYAQFHYEWNYKFFDVKEMNFYWGLGGFVGIYDRPVWVHGDYYRNGKYYYNGGYWEQKTSAFAGVSGIFGIEYTMKNHPFSFGANLTPGVSILPEVNAFGNNLTPWGGIHANYTFK